MPIYSGGGWLGKPSLGGVYLILCVKEKARIKGRDGDFHNYFSRIFYIFLCMSYRHNFLVY